MVAPDPTLFAAAIFFFFFCTYTAWSKAERRLSYAGNCGDVLLARRGLAHTLVELNKILALTGMAMLPCAYFFENARAHVEWALWSQGVHALYSTWKYYGSKIPHVSGYPGMISELLDAKRAKRRLVGVKRISVIAGVASIALLAAQILVPGYTRATMSAVVLATALVHFIAMEVDFKLVLQVRTTGKWTIPLALASIVGLAVWGGAEWS